MWDYGIPLTSLFFSRWKSSRSFPGRPVHNFCAGSGNERGMYVSPHTHRSDFIARSAVDLCFANNPISSIVTYGSDQQRTAQIRHCLQSRQRDITRVLQNGRTRQKGDVCVQPLALLRHFHRWVGPDAKSLRDQSMSRWCSAFCRLSRFASRNEFSKERD